MLGFAASCRSNGVYVLSKQVWNKGTKCPPKIKKKASVLLSCWTRFFLNINLPSAWNWSYLLLNNLHLFPPHQQRLQSLSSHFLLDLPLYLFKGDLPQLHFGIVIDCRHLLMLLNTLLTHQHFIPSGENMFAFLVSLLWWTYLKQQPGGLLCAKREELMFLWLSSELAGGFPACSCTNRIQQKTSQAGGISGKSLKGWKLSDPAFMEGYHRWAVGLLRTRV